MQWTRDLSPCPSCGGDTFFVSDLKINPDNGKFEEIAWVVCQREMIKFKYLVNDNFIAWLNSIESQIKKIKIKDTLNALLVELEQQAPVYKFSEEKQDDQKESSPKIDRLVILSDPNWKCDLNDIHMAYFYPSDGLLEITIKN